MGQFLFDVPDSATDFLNKSLWKDAYICGIEGVPFQSRNHFEGSRLTINRMGIDSSGKLYMTCPIRGLGMRTLATCSLRSLESQSHLLPLEFARGSCYRARIQSDIWERSGLEITDKFREYLQQGTELFLESASCRSNPALSATQAIDSLESLEQAIHELGESYAMQAIMFRKQREPHIGTLLAGTVTPPSPVNSEHSDAFTAAFNSACVRLNWSDIETDSGSFDFDRADQAIQFCMNHGLRVIGGPLIDFRERLMPHWLYLLEDDFESFLKSVTDYVEKTVVRFRGSVQLWNCAAGLNTNGPIELDDEQALRLALGILQTVRRHDPNTPAIMSFDQPFGEYLAKFRDGISPMHFADALIRSGLGLAGIGLECRINYKTNATLPRSAVDFGLMIDRWATLGIPMLVQLAVPGSYEPDVKAQAPCEVLRYEGQSEDPSAEQLKVAGPILRTLLAKHIVHGVVWDGWSDAEPHVTSHAGVIDSSGHPRPLLEYLTRVRREFLV